MRSHRVLLESAVAMLIGATSPVHAQPAAPETAPAQPPDPQVAREQARPIAAAALAAFDAGQFAEAISGFSRADAIFPAPQYRVYIARAHIRAGKLASAARAYEAALAMQPPPGAEGHYGSTQQAASAELAWLRTRVPAVTVAVLGAPAAAVQVTVDGTPIAPAALLRVELDPGAHTIVASAPGFPPVTSVVNLAESTFTTVELRLEPVPVPGVRSPSATSAQAPGPPGRPGGPGEEQATPGGTGSDPSSYSHRWKPGIVLRGDIDPVAGGVLVAPGLSFGVLDHFEVGVSALIGRDAGVEPSVRAFFLRGAWKPLVEVAAPIFVVDGARAGVRGAAGVQWDFHRHFGVFVEVGGAYFPSPPPGYESAYFLPSAGVQGRL